MGKSDGDGRSDRYSNNYTIPTHTAWSHSKCPSTLCRRSYYTYLMGVRIITNRIVENVIERFDNNIII